MTEKEKGEKKKLSKNKDMVQLNEKLKKKTGINNIREIQKTRTIYGKSENKKEFLKTKNGNAEIKI